MNLSHLKGHACLLGANITWGLMSPFSKMVILGGIVTPVVITHLRMGGAMILFWILSLFLPKEHVPFRDLLRMAGAGLIGILINQSLFMFGVGLTSPADASIITTSMPLWVMLLAALILGEPITGKKAGGIACGATGALLLILGGNKVSGMGNVWGDAMVLGAQFSYALYLVLYRNFVKRYTLVTLMKWMFTFAYICCLPYTLPEVIHTKWLTVPMEQVWVLLFTVVFGTFVAYVFIMYGQQRLRPTIVGMYNYFQPVVATIVAIYWGLDKFTWIKVLAVLLIFSGVFLVTRSKSKAQQDEALAHRHADTETYTETETK